MFQPLYCPQLLFEVLDLDFPVDSCLNGSAVICLSIQGAKSAFEYEGKVSPGVEIMIELLFVLRAANRYAYILVVEALLVERFISRRFAVDSESEWKRRSCLVTI